MTPHFANHELTCKCGCGRLPSLALAWMLEETRKDGGGWPIVLSSGMRCPGHNKNVGSRSTSLHIPGLAVDVVRWGKLDTRQRCPKARQDIIDLFTRNGWWCYDGGDHIHADFRLRFPRLLSLRQEWA